MDEMNAIKKETCPECGGEVYTADISIEDDMTKITACFECNQCEYSLELEVTKPTWRKVSSRD